jgi:hypothetical protein
MGMTERAWKLMRSGAIAGEKRAAKEKKKAYKPSSRGAEHKYKGTLVTPGSRAQRGSDSVRNRVVHAFNQDGSRLRFHQRWIAVPDGSEHHKREAALKRCGDGELPYIDRFTR